MRVLTICALLLILSVQELQAENKHKIYEDNWVYPDTIIIRDDDFLNPGFEEWIEGIPDGWSELIDRVGYTFNNVTVSRELNIKTEGEFSAKVQSVQPFGGISHQVVGYVPPAWNILPQQASAAVLYAKENGTSAFLGEHTLMQDDFLLPVEGAYSSAIRNAHALRIDNGDFIELFSACTTSEASYQGSVYMKRNGGKPELFMQYPNHRTWAWPGVVDMGSKYVFVSIRIGSDGQTHLFATDVSRDFNIKWNDRLIFDIDSTNVQCYSMLKISGDTVILPIVYAKIDKVDSGPWFLDVLTTTNFNTVKRLNQPKTYPGRGLMEAYPVLLSDQKVAILCRTNQGHLAKAIFNPTNRTLSSATATDIIQPGAGSYARNLSDNSILLSWLANLDMRKVLVMAVSDNDMSTWQSYHVIMTGEAMGHNESVQPPYIHQPFIYEDWDGSLICYFEEVLTPSEINLYKSVAQNYRITNVAARPNEWQEISIEKPTSTAFVQLVNVIGSMGVAYFDQPATTINIAALPRGLKFYPNPVKDRLNIVYNKPVVEAEVIDINGRLVNSYHGVNEIPMQNIINGIYFIKLSFGKESYVFKVVKAGE